MKNYIIEKLGDNERLFESGVLVAKRPESFHKNQVRDFYTVITDSRIEEFLGQIKQVNYFELTSNQIAGNHYHKEKDELFFIASGKVLFFFEENENRHCFYLSKGSKFLAPKKVTHTLFSPNNSAELIELTNQVWNEGDTYKKTICKQGDIEKILKRID
jgi:mannose-6-phosphate isomerase-like protein (cupin superfamily)